MHVVRPATRQSRDSFHLSELDSRLVAVEKKHLPRGKTGGGATSYGAVARQMAQA
jgi:hypothetical protein